MVAKQALFHGPRVNLVGFVEDITPYCHRASIALTPLRAGSGLKVKILDYLAHGLPCVGTPGSTVFEVIQTVEDVAGIKLNVRLEGRRPGDAPSTVASNKKIKEALRWSPQLDDLRTIVLHALAWEEKLALGRVYREPC